MLESGIKDVPREIVYGLLAPRNTPAAVVSRLNCAITEAIRVPEVQSTMAKLGIDTKLGTAEQYAALIAEDCPLWIGSAKLPASRPNDHRSCGQLCRLGPHADSARRQPGTAAAWSMSPLVFSSRQNSTGILACIEL